MKRKTVTKESGTREVLFLFFFICASSGWITSV